MAPRTIRLGGDNAPEPVEVYIFENKYHLRRVTRSVQKKLEKVDDDLKALTAPGGGGDDSDKIVAALGAGLEALLQSNGTKAPSAKKVIVDSWKADTLDLTQLNELYEELQEAATERPT